MAKPAGPKRTTGSVTNRVPKPRLYLYFEAIVRHGSIRAAAEALRIASSALNRRLLDLEAEAGTLLFDRLRNGVRLTAAGEIYAAHVRRTLDDVEQAGQAIQALQGRMLGHIAIGSAESAAVDLLPRALMEIQRDLPGLRFSVAVGAPRVMLEDLLADHVDLILTHEAPRHPDVTVLAVVESAFSVMMRIGHALSDQKRLFMRDCGTFPVVLAEEQLAARALVEDSLTRGALDLRPVLITNMFEVMKQYVRVTDAISFQFSVGPPPLGLAVVPLADPHLAGAHLTLAVRRGRILPPYVEAVCEKLRSMIGKNLAR